MAKVINLTQNQVTIVDDEDFQYFEQFKWHYTTYGYAKNNKLGLLHRIILDVNFNQDVDHKNGNKLDNRKCNLRICNKSQNGMNRNITKKSTSGYKGVYWKKDRNKWRAQIQVNKKSIFIGYFENKEDAAKAYNEAAVKYHKEFAKLNKIGYNL